MMLAYSKTCVQGRSQNEDTLRSEDVILSSLFKVPVMKGPRHVGTFSWDIEMVREYRYITVFILSAILMLVR